MNINLLIKQTKKKFEIGMRIKIKDTDSTQNVNNNSIKLI